MDDVYLRVSDLEKLVSSLKANHFDYVGLSIMDAEDDFPAELLVEAVRHPAPGVSVDYDPLPSDPELGKSHFSLSAIHTNINF